MSKQFILIRIFFRRNIQMGFKSIINILRPFHVTGCSDTDLYDMPAGRLINNALLLALARAAPGRRDDLHRLGLRGFVQELRERQRKIVGKGIVHVMLRATV